MSKDQPLSQFLRIMKEITCFVEENGPCGETLMLNSTGL
jgi:hypothetical protein